jgi:TonB family protein
MRHMKMLSMLLCAALALPSLVRGQYGPLMADWQSVKIVRNVDPIFPYLLTQQGVTNGEARIALNTDSEGKLVDFLVIAYSRPEFAEASVTAMKQWKFEPARLRGTPVGTTIEIYIYFEAKGVVVSTTTIDQLEQIVNRLTEHRYAYGPCSLRELDRIPTPLVTVKPLYSEEFVKRGLRGKVTVDFYITEAGAVRLPSVSPYDNSELTALALDALRQWKFEPPTRNGNPALVKASQVFNFSPSETTK